MVETVAKIMQKYTTTLMKSSKRPRDNGGRGGGGNGGDKQPPAKKGSGAKGGGTKGSGAKGGRKGAGSKGSGGSTNTRASKVAIMRNSKCWQLRIVSS